MNGDGRPIFLDTNVLVYASIRTSPLHEVARSKLVQYRKTGAQLWLSQQILREYLATVTRPQLFTPPVDLQEAIQDIRLFQRQFQVADSTSRVTGHLLALLESVQAAGKQIHDANIVATMQAYEITHLVTNNVDDFRRFSHLITILPLDSDETSRQGTAES